MPATPIAISAELKLMVQLRVFTRNIVELCLFVFGNYAVLILKYEVMASEHYSLLIDYTGDSMSDYVLNI